MQHRDIRVLQDELQTVFKRPGDLIPVAICGQEQDGLIRPQDGKPALKFVPGHVGKTENQKVFSGKEFTLLQVGAQVP